MNHLVFRANRLLFSRLTNPSSSLRSFSKTTTTLSNKDDNYTSNQSDHDHDFRHSEELAKERYDIRANEEIGRKRARLLYQSRKRGMLENGVILASFADKYLQQFDAQQLDEYDRLINLPTNDWDIFYWATKTKPTPAEYETAVMQKLRDHLKSKVSKQHSEGSGKDSSDKGNDDTGKDKKGSEKQGNRARDDGHKSATESVLGKSGLEDVVFPAANKNYALEINPQEIDLTRYREELFDYREKTIRNQTFKYMTDWRKEQLAHRLKRGISSPVSLRHMDVNKKTEIFTQGQPNKDIANEEIINTNLIDSIGERKLKHHDFLQYLLGSQFTNDVLDYDDEAEAWANMIWHRNYGTHDSKIAVSDKKCTSCHAKLHCCDHGLDGYVPREILAQLSAGRIDDLQCQRCKFSDTYGAQLNAEVTGESYINMLRQLRDKPQAIIVLLVDLTDFPSGIWKDLRGIIGRKHLLIVVGNKLDLLPYDGPYMVERVTRSLRASLPKLLRGHNNYKLDDLLLISARTGFGVEKLVTTIYRLSEPRRDVYLLGTSNSGKSTLYNALLQSDLSAIRDCDLLSRVTTYQIPGIGEKKLLKFPIYDPDDWEIFLKIRLSERFDRNTDGYFRSLEGTSKHRQEAMPHMSMLINRMEYPPLEVSNCNNIQGAESSISVPREEVKDSQTKIVDNQLDVKFCEDHPLSSAKSLPLLSAGDNDSEDAELRYFHCTPSASCPDQIHRLFTTEERLEVYPNETFIPRRYSLRPLQTLFIGGVARLDLMTSTSHLIVTVFASRFLPVHVMQTRKADQFYATFLGSSYLGVPFGDEERMKDWPKLTNSREDYFIKGVRKFKAASDIVLGSIGWVAFSLTHDHECIVRAYTPQARGISQRTPPLLINTRDLPGKKIRDTPVFQHPRYTIERMSA